MSALVEVDGVCAQAGGRAVLDEVSLRVGEGERVALVGENGAGKTTLLEIVLGLRAPSAGRVRVLSRAPLAAGVGFVLQQPGETLFPWLTLAQSFAMPLRAAGVPRAERERRVAQARALLDAGAQLDPRARPGELSGGQRQLAALVQAVAASTRLLVCDEPLSAIDGERRVGLRRALRALCERPSGPSLLFVTHDPLDVRELATRVIELPARATRGAA